VIRSLIKLINQIKVNIMNTNTENRYIVDIHIDSDGKPVASINGVVIDCIGSIQISSGTDQFNEVAIRCTANLKPDDSHITKQKPSRHEPSYVPGM